jgi:flagellar motility protein MotE (MotC chaperone)
MTILNLFKQKKEEKKQQVENLFELLNRLREIDEFSSEQADALREAADRIDAGLALRALKREQKEMLKSIREQQKQLLEQTKKHQKEMLEHTKVLGGVIKVLAIQFRTDKA